MSSCFSTSTSFTKPGEVRTTTYASIDNICVLDDLEEYKAIIKNYPDLNYYHIFDIACEAGAFKIMEYITYVQNPREQDGFNTLKYESRKYLETALEYEAYDVFTWLVNNGYCPWNFKDECIPLWIHSCRFKDNEEIVRFLQTYL